MKKRNVYFAYMNIYSNTTELFDLTNGEIETFKGFDILKHINNSVQSDCYISRVDTFAKMFPGGKLGAERYKKMDVREPLLYEYGKCTFRSFYALFGGQDVSNLTDMFDSKSITVCMHLFLQQFGDVNKSVIQYTLAYQVQRQFFEDIADELWEEHKKNHHYYYDVQTYRDMYAGNKAGTMFIYNNKASYHENIDAWDKKSAYPSVMVNDDVFPIGRIKCVGSVDSVKYASQWILRHIQSKKWVKVVIQGKHEDLKKWYDKELDVTALEYWNLFACHRMGLWDKLVEAMCESEYRMYDCTITGYLHQTFRDKIVVYFNDKEQYPKNSCARFMKKTSIDMLYGKGLQDFNFKDIYEIQKHFRGRGKNYLTPELSLHCVARLEYEIIDAYLSNESVYCDTDGVKVKCSAESSEYFNKKNREIMHRNNCAGYDTNIGIWDDEGHMDKLLIFAKKCYVYESNGKLDGKLAGVPQDVKQYVFDTIGGDKLQHLREKGFYYPVRKYKIGSGTVNCNYESYNHLRGDLEHE